MIKNYLKVALRHLLRHKEYTVINVFGLAVGISSCLLIMLFVRSELSYDRFHSKANRIYRVWQRERYQGQDFVNVVTPLPTAAALKNAIPEVEAACRVYNFNALVKVAGNSFTENINMVDNSFFTIFDFKLQDDSRKNPFPSTGSVVITPQMAKKIFGNGNPIGKNIEMQLGDNNVLFNVSGIAQESPEESSIKYDMLISYDNAPYLFKPGLFHSWTNIFNETYLLLRDKVRAADVERKFPAIIKQQFGADYREGAYSAYLQPITDIHLNNALPAGNLPVSNAKYSYILSTVGLMILLLACINFIVLSVGRSATRAMEVGVRKVLGAERLQLIRQFWGEAFLLTLISVLLGLLLATVLTGPFNQLIQKNLRFRFDWLFILCCFLLMLLVAVVAGIYPALILSGFNPIEVLKGKLKIGNKAGFFRHSLIVAQFVIAIGMIICTMVIGRQMQYLQNKDLGYSREQVVIVPTNKKIAVGFELAKLYQAELLKHPEVAAVTASVFSFAETPWATLGYTDDKKNYRNFQFNEIDPNFINALHIPIVAGRNFEKDNTADKYGSIMVNEALVKEYGWTNAIGKKLPGHFREQIIGVTKDFNYESLHTKVKPLVLALSHDSIFKYAEDISFANAPQPRISVRMKPGSLSANIGILKQAWSTIAPNQDFEYHFLDDAVAAWYQQEQRTDTVIKLASALSIFIACMGLFGLATLTVQRRIKEIGIRKVLGASVVSLVTLLSQRFVRIVIIASCIAFPLAWLAMNSWLKDFAYRTSIDGWLFVAAGILALVIALVTVSFQSIRAAITNPSKNLRTE